MAFWVTLLLFVATFVLSEVLKPKPKNENARPASLGDFTFPTATEGRVVPLVWGTVKLAGPNVVWYGDLTQKAIKKKIKTGIFSSNTITTGYTYDIGIQFALCRGPIDELRRIWIGDKEVSTTVLSADGSLEIDKPNLFGGNDLGQGGVSGTVRWREGTETQAVVTYLTAFQSQGGDTPAYRGTAFCTFENGNIGNSTSIAPWAFEVRRLPPGPGAAGAKAVNSGADANPAYVIYEILTNDEWGLGFPDGDIDVDALNTAADTFVTEGNGFSFVLDNAVNIGDILEEVQRQVDGVVFLDQRTGKWTLKLARQDFVVGDLLSLSETNILEVKDFSRGSWDDTTNQITTEFTDRSRDYFKTFAMAQDMANFRIQGTISKANVIYPGVKDKTLANSLAWRDLRALSFPLAKATVIVDRTFWDVNPTQALKWTSAALGFTDLIMRVTRVDLGQLADGQIEINLIQDVFATETPSFGDPIATGWVPPSNTLVAIPAAQSLAFEAPKAFIERDTDPITNGRPFRAWAAARRQNDGAVEFDLRTRLASTGQFVTGRTVDDFMLIGQLTAAITEDHIDSVIEVTPTPDAQSTILAEFEDLDAQQIGENLQQLILIDQEFMLVDNATVNASNIDLNSVYRGALDTVPTTHGSSANVYMIFVGGGIDSRSYLDGQTLDVKLVTRSTDSELSEGAATNLAVTMANRHLRPYPPIGMTMNGGSRWATSSQSLDANGSLDASGVLVGYDRRDFRTTNETEVHVNPANLPADFPTANDTRYRLRVFDTSSGSVELYVTGFNSGTATILVERTRVLRNTSGSIPTSLRVDVETRHTFDTVDHDATLDLSFDFPTASAELAADFNMGVIADLVIGASYTAPDTGTYTFNIGTPNTGGPIEARINGGAFATVIATSGTSGTLAGVTAADTIEVRSNGLTLGTPPDQTILTVIAPTSSNDAYAIFTV